MAFLVLPRPQRLSLLLLAWAGAPPVWPGWRVHLAPRPPPLRAPWRWSFRTRGSSLSCLPRWGTWWLGVSRWRSSSRTPWPPCSAEPSAPPPPPRPRTLFELLLALAAANRLRRAAAFLQHLPTVGRRGFDALAMVQVLVTTVHARYGGVPHGHEARFAPHLAYAAGQVAAAACELRRAYDAYRDLPWAALAQRLLAAQGRLATAEPLAAYPSP